MTAVLDNANLLLTPACNGIRMTPREFDQADGERGYRYELINGVLVVTPIPERSVRSANQALSFALGRFQDANDQGAVFDDFLYEELVHCGDERRRCDLAIWAGLGQNP